MPQGQVNTAAQGNLAIDGGGFLCRQRRKMLRSSLKALGGGDLCEAAGVPPEARAETIDIEGFLALADTWRLR